MQVLCNRQTVILVWIAHSPTSTSLGDGALIAIADKVGCTTGRYLIPLIYLPHIARRPAPKIARADDSARTRARAIEPKAIMALPGDDEFVILVARRIDAGHVAVVGQVEGDANLVEKALRKFV